jgi:predicted metal-dependent enzyme (double-stranded beta helix superfamily)
MAVPCPSLDDLITRLRASIRVAAPRLDAICREVATDLAPLLRNPAWLPAAFTVPDPSGYRRELLHEEEDGAFSIGCFVWGAGQATPIHDHRCWGVAGVLVGTLREESFVLNAAGALEKTGADAILRAGDTSDITPTPGDIHRVGAATDDVSISIHVYGERFANVCRTRYAAPVVTPPGWYEGRRPAAFFPESWRPYF